MNPGRSYLRWFFGLGATLVVMVAAWNFAVDPYSVFGSPHIARFNANKPDFVDHLRLTHVYAVYRRTPGCVLLGTSRTGKGLDPGHEGLSGLNCYNMALPDISLYEMRRYFQHAQSIRPLQLLVLGLDFRVFNAEADRSGAFSESRLEVDADGKRQFNLFSAVLPDLAGALISLPATQASFKTVRQQAWVKDTLAANGYWAHLGDGYNHQTAFLAYTRNSIRRYAEMRGQQAVFDRNADELRALLRAAYTAGVDVRLLIPPSHAWHWQTLEMSGLWPRFETMKRLIVTINDEESERARRPAFPVWDFSGAYGPSLESAPKSEHDRLHWYWEPVHYQKALGDLMLNRVLGESVPPQWADFGARLDSVGIEAHLARLRRLQSEFAEGNPDVVAGIQALMIESGRLGE